MLCSILCVCACAPTRESEKRVRLGSHADTDDTALGLLVDLGLPIVHVVLFGYREIAQHGALRVKELDLCASLNKAVGNLKLRLKLPCGDALFLNCEIL